MTQHEGRPVLGLIPEKEDRGSFASWVDSAALKLVQYMLTLVLLPAVTWGLNTVVNKLSAIEERLASYATTNATVELRLQSVERSRDALLVEVQRLREENSQLRAAVFPVARTPPGR